MIESWDLPISKGLQECTAEDQVLADELPYQPVLEQVAPLPMLDMGYTIGTQNARCTQSAGTTRAGLCLVWHVRCWAGARITPWLVLMIVLLRLENWRESFALAAGRLDAPCPGCFQGVRSEPATRGLGRGRCRRTPLHDYPTECPRGCPLGSIHLRILQVLLFHLLSYYSLKANSMPTPERREPCRQ
jgi:uncharacterized protein DUF1931